jgi:hypothetical protein
MDRYTVTEPGQWQALLSEVFGAWRIEKRDLCGHPTKFFVGELEGKEVTLLDFSIPTALEVGMKVMIRHECGWCSCHSRPAFEITTPVIQEGVTGRIVGLGLHLSLNLPHCTRGVVMVETDPETTPGRHRWVLGLPPVPLMVITEAQGEAITYGGLFA